MRGYIAALQLCGANGLCVTTRVSDSPETLVSFVTNLMGEPTESSGTTDNPEFKCIWRTRWQDAEDLDHDVLLWNKEGLAYGGDLRGDFPEVHVRWVKLDTTFTGYCD